MRLDGKVAVVTGASSGLGRAMAERFIQEGAQVVFSDINPYPEILPESGRFLKADTSKSAEVEALVAYAVEQFGKLDIMVNNAGIGLTGELSSLSNEDWDKVIAINLTGAFYGVRAASAYMKEKGIKGSIINIASILGQVGFRTAGAYCASKGGINQLSRTAALELAPLGIRVNSIAPGFIKTNMTKGIQDNEAANAMLNSTIPLGHMGDPEDIALAAVYLASDESKYATGSVLYVDGGYMAQ